MKQHLIERRDPFSRLGHSVIWAVWPRGFLLALALLACLVTGVAGAETVISFDPALGELPEGVAVDKPGNIWVTLTPLCQVRQYTPEYVEILRVTLVPPDSCFGSSGYGVVGLAVDSKGIAYAALATPDPATRGVYAIDPRGQFLHIPGTGGIVMPNALAFDHNNGTLYVTDYWSGAIWRVPRGRPAELWIQHADLSGTVPPPFGSHPMGANGIAVGKDEVFVAVTWSPRLVRVPINRDGSAGVPEILVPTSSFYSAGVWALDGITLDVHGNFYVAAVAPGVVIRISSDGNEISQVAGPAEGVTAAPYSLAFGTGKGNRQAIFVTMSLRFGGVGSAVVRLDVGIPGMPVP